MLWHKPFNTQQFTLEAEQSTWLQMSGDMETADKISDKVPLTEINSTTHQF